jgi:hypothetical protein
MQVKRNHPHFYHKTDIFGRPVYYELLGDLNLPEVLKLCDIERLIRLHCLGWEKVRGEIFPCCSIAAGRDVYTCVTVLDLKGLKMTSFTKDTREYIAAIASIDQVRTICIRCTSTLCKPCSSFSYTGAG